MWVLLSRLLLTISIGISSMFFFSILPLALFLVNMAHKRDVGRATEYYFWNQCDVLSSLSMAFANFGRGLSIVAYSDCFVND
jgi:hypothetical protein